MFIPFLYELRSRKVPVGATEAVALGQALVQGLHDSSLEGFYFVSRALLVHDEKHLDAFDQAFAKHFQGIESSSMEITAVAKSSTEEMRALIKPSLRSMLFSSVCSRVRAALVPRKLESSVRSASARASSTPGCATANSTASAAPCPSSD